VKKAHAPHVALIREALAAIARYHPPDEAAFLAHQMAQDAILMRLQEIGENLAQIRKLDEAAFEAMAHDSWLQLIGLRNVISHGYHTIKPKIVWRIVTDELPIFAQSLSVFD
jgi:uncharacterized protein with HEPN domain